MKPRRFWSPPDRFRWARPWVRQVLPAILGVAIIAVTVRHPVMGAWLSCAILAGLGVALGLVGGEPWHWQVRAAGLYEQMPIGRYRWHSWASIREVIEDDDGLQIQTDTSTLRFGGSREDATELASMVREHLVQQPAEPSTIPPEQIAAWLGIGLDDSLRLERPRWKRFLPAGLWLALAAYTYHVYVGAPYLDGLQPFAIPLGYLVLAALGARRERVIVTPYAIHAGRHRIAWDEVQHRAHQPIGQFLTWSGGAVPLHGPFGERVADAAAKLLDARDRGAILPRMTDIPDHALSRAESVEVNAERGISPAEDGR